MMKKILLLAMLLAVVPVFADQCLTSVDATTSVTSNVTTGTNVQISATPSGSCSSGEVTLQLVYSNCSLTVTDPSSPGYYTGVSTGTQKTFTVTSGSAGVCTITSRGTTSDGSVDSNTPIIIEFIDPSTLTVAGQPISTAMLAGQGFGLSVNITNPQSSDVLTSYALSLPTGLTRTAGDLASGSDTIYGGAVKSLLWTITHSTCFTGSNIITFQLGDNTNAFTTTVSGNTSCGSSSNSSSSGGGGAGAGSNATTKETKTFTTAPGTSVILPFIQITSPGITQIEIKTITAKPGVQISLAAAIKPSAAADPVASSDGKVYSYAEITKENVQDSDFSLIKIKFKVPSVWMSANNIDHTKVYMYRYTNNAWTRLATTFKSNDSSNYFFEAESPGFSVFSIAGYKPTSTVPTSTTSSGPAITVISPTAGLIVRNSTVEVQLSASGITLAEPKSNFVSGEAHFHVWLDDANEQIGPQTTFTFYNVTVGSHTIKVELRASNQSALNPAVSSSVTFSVEAGAVQAAAGPPLNIDFTIIGIAIVILLVAGAGAYFVFIKGDAKAGAIAARLPKHSARKLFEGGIDGISTAVGRLLDMFAAGATSAAKKMEKKKQDASFSGGYEFRGEVNYQSYTPDVFDAPVAKKDDDKSSADSGAGGTTEGSGPVSA